jgi:hypothetical protein
MKNLAIFNQLTIITLLAILLISCNTSEKDWNNTKMINSKTSYQEFIKQHPSSIFAESAQKAIDSFEWVAVINTHNIDSLELFMENHMSSIFLTTSVDAMDSIEWNMAYYSRDTTKLNSYIKKYPNSNNKQKAEDIIWEINWPPVKVEKANSLSIFNQGHQYAYGMQMFYQGASGVAQFFGGMTPSVYIWRDFSKGIYMPIEEMTKLARNLGLRPGVAYLLVKDNRFKVIRKVDLNKTNEQLCAEFGVSSN